MIDSADVTSYRSHLSYSKSTLLLLICLIFSSLTTASDNQATEHVFSTSLALGSPAAFLAGSGIHDATKETLALDNNNVSYQPKIFSFINHLGEKIKVVTDNFAVDIDGSVSMNGQVLGVTDSEFILQGNNDKIYGWIILRQQDIAYQYTTKNGHLLVEQIAITDVHPHCDFGYHSQLQTTALSQFTFPAVSKAHLGAYPGTHVGKLESRPGSPYVILLDTRRIMSDGIPYDVSKAFIWTTWQIVAASFSMLDVNVTTNREVYNNAAVSRRGGATMYREMGRSSCHYAFGTATFCTLYRERDAYGQGRIAAHEIGHLLHLGHDGGYPGGEYYNGITDFQWVPIMGNIWMATGWEHALHQWSKGEYSGASNREDDFNIINGFIPFKPDDITTSKALVIDADGKVNASNNTGQIERNTDTDIFTFTINSASSNVNFTIDRTEHIGGGMFDAQAYIKDSFGYTLAQSNENVNRAASFSQNLPAGNYTLEISGGAEGTPNWGFSNYSSVGHYAIEGQISGIGDGNNEPRITNLDDGDILSGASQLFTWDTGNAQGFWFYAGSSKGEQDYYRNSSQINETSHTVTGLPTDGSLIHVTFHYLVNGQWFQLYLTYTAADDTNNGELGLTSPLEGDTLTGSSQRFTWDPGDATGFWFYAGSSHGAQDYYRNSSQIYDTSHTVTGLPTDGSQIHITFHYLMNGRWSQLYYVNTAANHSALNNTGSK